MLLETCPFLCQPPPLPPPLPTATLVSSLRVILVANSRGPFPTLCLLTAPTWTFLPWASKTSCSPSPPQSPLGAPLTPAGWSSQSCHWASSHTGNSPWVASSWASSSRAKTLKCKSLLGTSPCVALTQAHQVQSQLPSPRPPLPSAACLTVHPGTQTYTLSPSTPTPVSLGQARQFYHGHL